MRRSDFSFELPEELIAQYPMPLRSGSRLLCLDGDSGAIADRLFTDLESLLQPGDLLVFNNTRVIPARLHGVKTSGGKVEVLVERILDEHCVLAHVRASKSPKPGSRLHFATEVIATLEERHDDLFKLCFSSPGDEAVMTLLEQIGHMPLPPYIGRGDEPADRERYQTVYAQKPGAVAAPTAGLHFDQAMLQRLSAKGVATAFVTLHVGAGTFQPVRVDDLEQHQMHAEWMELDAATCEKIRQTRAQGNRVIAVGTTSVRCLETAARGGELQPYRGDTDIFIKPGYQFKVVDALLTNFHLPESTLIMLVCAFAGYAHVMAAYQHAIAQRYRFYSYGDAMFLSRQSAATGTDS